MRVFEVIYQKKYDRYVGVHYNRHGVITGLNYEVVCLTNVTMSAIAKSDDNLMEIFEQVVSEIDCEVTKKYLINETIKRAEQIMNNITKLKP